MRVTRMMFPCLLMIMTLVLGCGNSTDDGSAGTEPERISVEELKGLLDDQADVIVVDVRSISHYDEGHIPGAISMPYPDGIQAGYVELSRDKTMILYCG